MRRDQRLMQSMRRGQASLYGPGDEGHGRVIGTGGADAVHHRPFDDDPPWPSGGMHVGHGQVTRPMHHDVRLRMFEDPTCGHQDVHRSWRVAGRIRQPQRRLMTGEGDLPAVEQGGENALAVRQLSRVRHVDPTHNAEPPVRIHLAANPSARPAVVAGLRQREDSFLTAQQRLHAGAGLTG